MKKRTLKEIFTVTMEKRGLFKKKRAEYNERALFITLA